MLHRAAGAIVLHPRSRPRAPCPHAHTLATPGLVRHPRRVRVAPPVCPCAAHVHTSYMPSTMHTPARQVSAALSRDAQGCSSVGPGARGAAAGNTGCRGCRRHSQRASARHARHHAAYTRTCVHTCIQVRDMQGTTPHTHVHTCIHTCIHACRCATCKGWLPCAGLPRPSERPIWSHQPAASSCPCRAR